MRRAGSSILHHQEQINCLYLSRMSRQFLTTLLCNVALVMPGDLVIEPGHERWWGGFTDHWILRVASRDLQRRRIDGSPRRFSRRSTTNYRGR
jgi:hypothetical protein